MHFYIHFCSLGLLALASCLFFYNTIQGGGDFQVYWHMAERVLAGQPLYLPEIDLSHGFKYPPWILPLFLHVK